MDSLNIPESVQRFINNTNKAAFENIYHFKCVDMEGNVVDEKFGMNVITNKGFEYLFTYKSSKLNLYFGTGSGTPSFTDNSLFAASPFPKMEIDNLANYNDRPTSRVYYDNTTGLISQLRVWIDGSKLYLDYNYSGITDDVEITEFALTDRNSPETMFVHGSIYDEDGNISSIIKKPNTRLYFVIYFRSGYIAKMINDLYDKGFYLFMAPWFLQQVTFNSSYFRFYLGYDANAEVQRHIGYEYWKPNEYYQSSNQSYRGDTSDPNVYEMKITGGDSSARSFKYDYLSTFKMGMESYNGGYPNATHNSTDIYKYYMLGFILNQLPETEDVEIEYIPTDVNSNYSFEKLFGTWPTGLWPSSDMRNTSIFANSTGALPMTQLNISSVSLYNKETHEWDIQVPFLNDESFLYDDIYKQDLGIVTMLLPNGVDEQLCRIMTNPFSKTHDLIKFTNTNMTIYASDSWWDTSSWTLITDTSNIQESERSRRYYILTTWSNNNMLEPIYVKRGETEIVKHGLLLTDDEKTDKVVYTLQTALDYTRFTGDVTTTSSDEYNWILIGDRLIYPEANKEYVLKSYNNLSTNYATTVQRPYAYKDRIVSNIIVAETSYRKYSLVCRVYTISDNGNTEPTFVDIIIIDDYGKSSNPYLDSKTGIGSNSENGWVLVENINDWYPVIVDVYGNEETENIPTGKYYNDKKYKYAFVLNFTDYMVYEDIDNVVPNTVVIRDLKTDEDIESFEIPLQYTITNIVGWREFIYIGCSVGADYATLLYNMNDKSLIVLLDGNHQAFYSTSTRPSNYWCESTMDYMIIATTIPGSTLRRVLLLSADEPDKVKFLHNKTNNDSIYEINRRACYPRLYKYNEFNKTLLLGTSSTKRSTGDYTYGRINVFDIDYINDKQPQEYYYSNNPLTDNTGYENDVREAYVPYKGNLYHINTRVDQYNRLLKAYSLKCLLYYKIKGTTTTITAYNNPFQITSGPSITVDFTNNLNKLF